ncbi:MAG: hypothetical protein BJ554DRAFT_4556 [Olpidium bornovanus]|uniref:Uncharacterized protein n=1 Tax=Olpidium bornovanus TaxID=278681 RepID=A0A8H8DF05_9FUNG|nr:MAG: hypothetical protein BJ554DRAFT_4556 [Olpidium bornovanus]
MRSGPRRHFAREKKKKKFREGTRGPGHPPPHQPPPFFPLPPRSPPAHTPARGARQPTVLKKNPPDGTLGKPADAARPPPRAEEELTALFFRRTLKNKNAPEADNERQDTLLALGPQVRRSAAALRLPHGAEASGAEPQVHVRV